MEIAFIWLIDFFTMKRSWPLTIVTLPGDTFVK
jgi:hypothetical protein